MIGETEWINDSSNLSMESAEFGELPLEKLDREKSGTSVDLELDCSRDGLNLAVSRVLKFESNSSCPKGSQKRLRCPSTDQSISAAKRSRTRAAGPATRLTPNNPGFQNERKAPVNFADILKATQERNIQKSVGYSSVDKPSPLSKGGGRFSDCGNTFPPGGGSLSRSSCGQASWVKRCFPKKGKQVVEARLESNISTNVSAIRRPLDANGNLHRVSERRNPRPQSQNKIKTNSIKQDDSKASQPASQEDNMMYAPTGCEVSNAEQCKPICSDSKALGKLQAPKGINMGINIDPTISKRNTTESQVWEMPKNAGIIANSKSSHDFLLWGACRRSMVANLISDKDITNEKCSSMKSVSQPNTIATVITPPCTTPARSQANESMSTEGTASASVILTQGTHDCINSRTPPTPSLSLTDAIQIPLPWRVTDQPDMKQLTKQHPERQVATSLPTLRPSIAPNRPEPRMQHVGRGRATRKRTHFQASGGKVFLTEHRISKRIRQLSIAKKTAGYSNYIRAVPREKRSNFDPRTPDPTERISKRRFDGKVRVWRRRLHEWDA
jgi:hypothetical protein